jgi:hypothetical protein
MVRAITASLSIDCTPPAVDTIRMPHPRRRSSATANRGPADLQARSGEKLRLNARFDANLTIGRNLRVHACTE